jgi:hypothetical protein
MKTMDMKKDDASEDEGRVRTRRRRRAMTNNDERTPVAHTIVNNASAMPIEPVCIIPMVF